ncbi:MAG: response regulator [Gemmatimonadota bacterium]
MEARTILIADDDIDTRIIVRAVLESRGMVVLAAATADDAVALAEQNSLDLIIVNYPMTSEDGRTVVERLRLTHQPQDCPILNITSRVVPMLLEEAAAQGVTLSLPKPIEVDSLVSAVTQLTLRPHLRLV